MEYEKSTETFLNGFFYFFGLIENPAEKKAKKIIRTHSREKMIEDIKKINRDAHISFEKIKEELEAA